MRTSRVSPRPLTSSLARFSSAVAMTAALTMAASSTAHAAPISWDGEAGDFLWGNPLNWSTNLLPSNVAPGDDLTFGTVAGTPVLLGTNRVANTLRFSQSNYELGGVWEHSGAHRHDGDDHN